MSFFARKAICSVCDNEVGLNRLRIKDKDWICKECLKKSGYKITAPGVLPINKLSAEDFKEMIENNDQRKEELEKFVPTKKIGNKVEFDDVNKKWIVLSKVIGSKKNSVVYNYNNIVSFELIQDGDSIEQGGLGRSLVGGALFGSTGAMVGGITGKKRTKGICTELKIKITMNDINDPVVYIHFLVGETKKDGFLYKQAIKEAHECLSTLQIICDQKQKEGKDLQTEEPAQQSGKSNIEQLKEFKELLDLDIITQEEFDKKKAELLN